MEHTFDLHYRLTEPIAEEELLARLHPLDATVGLGRFPAAIALTFTRNAITVDAAVLVALFDVRQALGQGIALTGVIAAGGTMGAVQ